jgi:hypothetical protein
MDFKSILPLIAVSGLLAACTGPHGSGSEDNVIGQPLKEISSLSRADGGDSQNAVIFDEVTRKIHVFELSDMQLLRSHSVSNPDKKHTVISHESGNYVIDFSEKSLTIYSVNGLTQKDPVRFQGQPLSAAFNSDENLLVMYDDTNSIAMLKMNELGLVTRQWVAGPKLLDDKTIRSGELLPNGQLILGLSDFSIGIVDVEQSILQKKWIFSSFDSTLGKSVSWIAAVADNPNQILVRSENVLAIFDLQTKTKVTSVTIVDERIAKLSKISSGHVVTRLDANRDQIRLYYAKGGLIRHQDLQKQGLRLLSSHLNFVTDQWTLVDQLSESDDDIFSSALDDQKVGRTLKSFRLSDMLPLQKTAVADQAQTLLSPSYLFSLFPSELGYAVRTNYLTLEKKEAKFFNMGHL